MFRYVVLRAIPITATGIAGCLLYDNYKNMFVKKNIMENIDLQVTEPGTVSKILFDKYQKNMEKKDIIRKRIISNRELRDSLSCMSIKNNNETREIIDNTIILLEKYEFDDLTKVNDNMLPLKDLYQRVRDYW